MLHTPGLMNYLTVIYYHLQSEVRNQSLVFFTISSSFGRLLYFFQIAASNTGIDGLFFEKS